MHGVAVIIGLVLIIAGGIMLITFNVPVVTALLTKLFGYSPVGRILTSVGAIVIGFIIMVFIGFRQKRGKYFKYY